jgi:hypothetical protein
MLSYNEKLECIDSVCDGQTNRGSHIKDLSDSKPHAKR